MPNHSNHSQSIDLSIYQIKYINSNGNEIARVNYGKIVPVNRLQNKKERYYFIKTMKIGKNKIYTSHMDLNREHSKIEIPFRPVIRYAMPVFDDSGKRSGIIVTNIDAKIFLYTLQRNSIYNTLKPMLVSNNGYYLACTDSSKRWGDPSDLNTGANFKKDYPKDVVSKILSGNAGVFFDSETNSVFAYALVYPGTKDIYKWTFIQNVSLNYGGFKVVSYLKKLVIILVLLALVIGTYLSFFASGWILKKLSEDLQDF